MSAEWWQLALSIVIAAVGATWWIGRAIRNSVDALYDRLKANDFKHVEDRFGQVDTRFEQVYARFEQVDARFEQVEARLDRVERRLTERMSRMETRLDRRMQEGFAEMKDLIRAA